MRRLAEKSDVNSVAAELDVAAVVFDVRDETSAAELDALRKRGILTVSIDDVADRRLSADLAFLPPTPQAKRLSWKNAKGIHQIGFEWVLLRPEFVDVPDRREPGQITVLVSAGGSDPAGITRLCCEATRHLSGIRLVVVLGPGYADERALDQVLASLKHDVAVHRAASDMAGLMSRADLALAAFGSSAYEFAAVGVPAVYVGLTDDHAESAAGLEAMGIAISAGVVGRVSPEEIGRIVRPLVADAARRQRIRSTARSLVDGRGALRIADRICAALKNR